MRQQKTKLGAKLASTQRVVTGIRLTPKQGSRPARRQGSHTKAITDPHAPILAPCSLFGPDGKERPGWEMWVGNVLFGRSDSKESLLQYYARIHAPLPTGHWRERSVQPQRRVPRRTRHEYETYEEDLEYEGTVLGGWD